MSNLRTTVLEIMQREVNGVGQMSYISAQALDDIEAAHQEGIKKIIGEDHQVIYYDSVEHCDKKMTPEEQRGASILRRYQRAMTLD